MNKYSAKKLTKLTGGVSFAPAISMAATGQRHQFPRTMRGTIHQGGFAERRCTDLESAPVSDNGREFVGSYSASTTPTNFGRKRQTTMTQAIPLVSNMSQKKMRPLAMDNLMHAPEESLDCSEEGDRVKGVVDLRAATGTGIGRGLYHGSQIVPPSECHSFSQQKLPTAK